MYRILIIFSLMATLTNCQVNNKPSIYIETDIKDSIAVISKSDSIEVGEYYEAIIYIPDFDSICEYSCLIGESKIIELSPENLAIEMIGTYDSIPLIADKDFYYIISKETNEKYVSYGGFIRQRCNNKYIYYPFKGQYTVFSEN